MKRNMELWRETTSTSPGSRHLGHYKVLFVAIDHSLPAKEQVNFNQYKMLYPNVTSTSSTTLKNINILSNNEKNVNMMIYKELSNSLINQLRVIHIYEADLTLFLGTKWKEAILQAQKERVMHPGQYGGLLGRDCTQTTMLEEYQVDYSLVTSLAFTNLDANLTAFYDRILYSVSSLTSRNYGVNKQVIFVHAATLEDATFKLKLSTKVLETGYKH